MREHVRSLAKPITQSLPVAFYANYPSAPSNYPAPLPALIRCAATASEIVILSAFYTPKFISKILAAVPRGEARKRCKIHVVLNGLRGVARRGQVDELKKTRASLIKMGFRNPDICVNDAVRLFHSKLYQFRDANQLHWFIGSANVSEFAFDTNDEILIRCRGRHPDVARYVAEVLEASVGLDDMSVEPPPSSLVHLFKSGVLYFKSSLRPQFLFERIPIPPSLRVSSETPPDTDPNEPFGPFNVRRCLNRLAGLAGGGVDDEQAERKRAALTPYAVETCFGFWVPSVYVGIVDGNIKRRSSAVEQDLGAVAGRLDENRSSVNQEFKRSYLGFLRRHQIDVPAGTEEKFKLFLSRLAAKLADEEYRKRCARPFLNVDMPEIWADPVASREFTNTFVEYVSFRLSQAGNKPRVIKKLQQAANLEGHDHADDVRQKLETWIRSFRSSNELQQAFA